MLLFKQADQFDHGTTSTSMAGYCTKSKYQAENSGGAVQEPLSRNLI